MRRHLLAWVIGALTTLSTLSGGVGAAELDPRSGLQIDGGWQLVAAHCGGCHSYRLITQQRGDADFWLATIRWMQRTQQLWAIPAEQEASIVSYLARNYNETDWGRRPSLRASLLPDASD